MLTGKQRAQALEKGRQHTFDAAEKQVGVVGKQVHSTNAIFIE